MNKIVKIHYLSRVEGEGGIVIRIKDGKIVGLQVNIFEVPRFFESLLRGRPAEDAIDFSSRICGICPVAYQMSAVHALESIFDIRVEHSVRSLRRLFYAGEWIESHALHIYFLQGPDFYGIESAWSGKEYLPFVQRGLALKKLGNKIISIIGGRPIHPVSAKVGGFFGMPRRQELVSLLPELEKAYEQSLDEIRWAANLDFPDHNLEAEYVSLQHHDEYPMNEGEVVSSKGIKNSMASFLENIQEYQVEYSTALHSGIRRNGASSPYLVGPLARFNNNRDKLPEEIQNAVRASGIPYPLTNIRMGIIARTIEMAYAFHEAKRLIRNYERPEKSSVFFEKRPGRATWITEAPRGMLINRYELDEKGTIRDCLIIPPTSQNLGHMERELFCFIHDRGQMPVEYLKRESEKIIRSYDPCISCAVHVLEME